MVQRFAVFIDIALLLTHRSVIAMARFEELVW